MRLCIGIVGKDLGFETILHQHGIPFQEIMDEGTIEHEQFPVININSREVISKDRILSYVASGGVVILNSRIYSKIFNCSLKKNKISYKIFDAHIFSGIGLVDFNTYFFIPKDNKISYLDSTNSIGIIEHGKGMICIFPFDFTELFSDYRSIRKKFYADRKELPSEIVSNVSKGKLSQLIFRVLVYLFNVRGLPFVHTWYYPDKLNLFAFRIDTDFCNMQDASHMYDLLDKYSISATWFIDTHSKNMLNKFYSQLHNNEVGLHCENHIVYGDYKKDYNNLKSGLDKLHNEKIDVHGFAAPFGEWNPNLDKVLSSLSFNYSSDFTFDYDDLPIYPIVNCEFSKVLQLPIHPISIGRLRRSHFTDEEMINYYLRLIERKRNYNQPVILYHHPHHQRWKVLEEVFSYVNQLDFWKPTFQEYFKWWNEKLSSSISVDLKDNVMNINCENERIFVRIYGEGDQYSLIKPAENINLNDVQWEKKKHLPIPADIARIRKKHWRDVLYNHETRKAKRRVIK